MSTYRYYQEARDTAWRALLRLKDKRLPVDAEALAKEVGMEVLPFPDAEENPRLAALLSGEEKAAAVSLRIRGKWHIFLREKALDDHLRRFAVAHELGHLLLGHETRVISPGVRAFESRENAGDILEDPEDLADYAADIFAVRLLAAACLLHELHIDSSGEIAALCGLPPRAAALRAERMELLNERDAFFTHTLERQVRDQFLPYLRSRQSPGTPEKRSVPLILPLEKKAPEAPMPKAEAPVPVKAAEPSPEASVPSPKSRRNILPILLAAAAAAALIIFLLCKG